jgi:predicted nucleic acid-binding protein
LRTYFDAGVLIEAARFETMASLEALRFLQRPGNISISSTMLKLEILTKPTFFKLKRELDFYDIFFRSVSEWIEINEDLLADAISIGGRYGLAGADAVHIVAALRGGAEEFVTCERKTSPLMRVRELKVISLNPT